MTVQNPAPSALPAPAPPAIPVLCVGARQAALLDTDGELHTMPHARARKMLAGDGPVMCCHAPYARHRLGADDLYAFDILELFAFVHPARFCVPTPAGLAKALFLAPPEEFEDGPLVLLESVQTLLSDLQKEERTGKKADPLEIARIMGKNGKGWPWTPFVCAALGEPYDPAQQIMAKPALNVWKHLPEWSEAPPPPPPAHHPVAPEESAQRLAAILGPGAESRAQQEDYARKMTAAFAPLEDTGTEEAPRPPPHIVLAEAGTGVGKTLGYLAPAAIWAEKNGGAVWVSTYTKNLQRQIDRELDRLYPDPALKDAKVTIRKGRENYLCLLNLEDTAAGAALAVQPEQAVAAGLMARWTGATRDGDLQGGDFPGWLAGLLGVRFTKGLADRRGECIYSACDHYHRCFVERAIRKARHAEIVVANHALVMVKAAAATANDPMPQRYVFDEAHHLFDAADSAFAGHLTARETHDLRRWIRGAEEGGRQSRARGLKRRVEDLVAADPEAAADLDAVLHEAGALPGPGWPRRLGTEGAHGPAEKFLSLVFGQVRARAGKSDGAYSLETGTSPLSAGLEEAAANLAARLRALQRPLRSLSARLRKKLADQAETLDTDTRRRLESVAASLDRRSDHTLAGWIAMLETLTAPGENAAADFVDWLEIERIEGRAVDVGMYRHWIDPMRPFAGTIRAEAHGIALTSATLRDGTGDEEEDWRVARERTGADYLSPAPVRFAVSSPFDYADRTRIIVVTDINRDDPDQVAAAFRELFRASGGGALGLFTAVRRLKSVHARIAQPLEESGLPLYAQHIDGMDTGTLVDIFRDELHACLLGTDAVRDGIDVPGESLRLLVYDRVPWPRPAILHKARRDAFGGRRYDELITRLKLRQAYGRLIRRASDRGVFVMLDSRLPTRLCGAFPETVEIRRLGLKDAIAQTREFLTAVETVDKKTISVAGNTGSDDK